MSQKPKLSRRQFLQLSALAATGFFAGGALSPQKVLASAMGETGSSGGPSLSLPQMAGLSDPATQPKFANYAPNALDPGFIFKSPNNKFKIAAAQTVQYTGLVDGAGAPLPTTVWGYGRNGKGITWPGRTFEVQSGVPIEVMWQNKLETGAGPLPHLLPVDTSLHWAYSLPGYTQYSIAQNGVPIVTHVHGGHTDSPFDGNPEYFFSPGWGVRGPRWTDKKYVYLNDQGPGTIWYHDHALGLTRLNVYAGLAGFYIIRDGEDTGRPDNSLKLPAFPYELAYAIQDRMFYDTGALFYPGFPGDPFWFDFITDQGLADGDVPQPSALAEFFGDHIVVNGVIWPKTDVEPRNYRMRLLNGSDSRFLAIRFRATDDLSAQDLDSAGAPIPFTVIGSDQGLAENAATVGSDGYLLINPGERYDIVFNFRDFANKRVIMENIGGDAPFGGDVGDALAPEDLFDERQTDRIMAFDVVLPEDTSVADDFDPAVIHHYGGNGNTVTRTRKVALFEGKDEYGRLQPLLGTAEPATDYMGNPVLDHDGTQIEGAVAWHSPTSENPALGATEVWEVYNATEDAHPVHLHLVNFQVLDRKEFTADLIQKPVMQHNGTTGIGFKLANIVVGGPGRPVLDEERAPKDMVTAYPGEVTYIQATFDKPGRYVWHCHILSHEDHEMMRVLHVGPGA